ncbi:hypothetical protein C0Q70_07626 [Pomacea canaliculata]|uniref:Uncharacterized protein n=1 Tax=Pomacea canaliculata TaxID=400727 RepID=A0A2T7PFJ9_POMCA|nr:hypothetical protein C0Q70_07626 [Pomacea canaliculata]
MATSCMVHYRRHFRRLTENTANSGFANNDWQQIAEVDGAGADENFVGDWRTGFRSRSGQFALQVICSAPALLQAPHGINEQKEQAPLADSAECTRPFFRLSCPHGLRRHLSKASVTQTGGRAHPQTSSRHCVLQGGQLCDVMRARLSGDARSSRKGSWG